MMLRGEDNEHFRIRFNFPTNPKPTVDEMINTYVKTLAIVLGSTEEEVKKKIYSVTATTYNNSFGALISREQAYKISGGLPGVSFVVPDSYINDRNKEYEGDLYVDGKVIPRPHCRF